MLYRLINQIYDLYLTLIYSSLRDGLSIKSHLTMKERVTLYSLAKAPKIQICLEIGSYLGASAYCISSGLSKKSDVKIFCIDTWANDSMSEGKRDTLREFSTNTAIFANIIVPVQGFSTNVVKAVADKTSHIDFMFIDGDHSYDGVKSDWEAYKGFLRPGSIIAFHDYGWAEGVKRVINEDVKPITRNHQNLPNMWWGTIS